MKRSEFILMLTEFLDSFPEGASNYHICDMIIGKAEREGMLPPTRHRFMTHNEASRLNSLGFIKIYDIDDDIIVNEWED